MLRLACRKFARPRRILICAPALLSAAAVAQQLPSAPSAHWQPPPNLHLSPPADAPKLEASTPGEPFTLAALIDLGEQRNPETRAAWQRAREAAAIQGVARAALFPTLTGLVLGQTTRSDVFFNTSFVRQTEGILEPSLELDYTIFDWNARLDAVRAARYDLFADDFAFNQYHLLVIDSVTRSYFQLLNSQGQVAAAIVNLENASTVASEVDARLQQGLATLPDALEARAAAAQAAYALASLKGTQSNAEAGLATTLRLPASTTLPVVPIERLAPPAVLADTAADAIARALRDRPDLLERESRVEAAGERIRQARTAYLPVVNFSGVLGRLRANGQQDQLPAAYGSTGSWNAQLNLRWTLFDGGLRSNQVARALAEKAAAEAELETYRDRIEDQVWTAYTNTQTAFAQQQAAEALLGAAESSYSAAVEAYGDGVRTLVDVVAAQRELAQARSDEITARTNVFQQAAELAFRTGELLGSNRGPRILPAAPAAAPAGAGKPPKADGRQ